MDLRVILTALSFQNVNFLIQFLNFFVCLKLLLLKLSNKLNFLMIVVLHGVNHACLAVSLTLELSESIDCITSCTICLTDSPFDIDVGVSGPIYI